MKCRPLRIAVVLLVLTAITSNIVGGTLAKYKVVDSSNDSAHVAKWGITVFADGNLFGKNYYGNPSNTISTSDDGRTITVKSVHNASIDNLVAPGTKNDVGLTFGISGKAETAVKVDVKIRDRSVVLRPNVYYIMHKLTDVTQDNFAVYQERYGGLYIADGESFILTDAYANGQTYYAVDNMTQLNTGGNWSYCPVVFEIVPTDGIHGLEVTKNGIKAYSAKDLLINAKDKSLDIISFFLKAFALNDGNSWPGMSTDNIYERTFSRVFNAGTDLESISASYSRGIYVGMSSERLTWSWDYQQSENTSLYDNADNILGRLSAEKQNGSPLDDNFVVICDRTYGWNKDSQLLITSKHVNGSADTKLIRPVEYIDYCLDVTFEIEMKVTQID